MLQKEFHAMGCRIYVCLDSDSRDAEDALEQVPGWFESWEQSLSRFREDSELSRMNKIHGIKQAVSESFWHVLRTSREMEQLSNGLVTPAVLDALEMTGYNHDFDIDMVSQSWQLPGESFFMTDLSGLEVFPDTREIILPAGLRLDFGGVAKGWAAHQTMWRLAEIGPVFVNAGGDISISGSKRDGKPWQVGIIDPLRPEMDLVRFCAHTGGVATSGKDYRKWLQNGILRHHIIDPRTGMPAYTDILAASVAAQTVMEAEMAAKVIFILGSEEGGEWLREHPKYSSLLVLDNGEVLANQNMKQLFRSANESTVQCD